MKHVVIVFLYSNIKVDTLSVKACFMKLKIDTPLVVNLFKFYCRFHIHTLNIKIYFHHYQN